MDKGNELCDTIYKIEIILKTITKCINHLLFLSVTCFYLWNFYFQVTFHVQELKRVVGGVNTMIGNNEGSLVVGEYVPINPKKLNINLDL